MPRSGGREHLKEVADMAASPGCSMWPERRMSRAFRWLGHWGAHHGHVIPTVSAADDCRTVAALSCHDAPTALCPFAVVLFRFLERRDRRF